MAFTIYNWSEVSSSLNQGVVSADIAPGVTPVIQGSGNLFSYFSTDAVATINAADYFLTIIQDLKIHDVIMVTGSDASEFIIVDAITYPDNNGNGAAVSTASFAANGAVDTANLVDLAVTTAKLDDDAVTAAKIDDGAVGSAALAATVLKYVAVPISAAAFNGMHVTPISLVAAQGANTLLVLDRVELLMTYNSAAFAAGGVAHIQYAATTLGAGVIASTTTAAAAFQATASTAWNFNAGVVAQPFTTTINLGLFLSNVTAAFTTGNSTMIAHVWYKVIPSV